VSRQLDIFGNAPLRTSAEISPCPQAPMGRAKAIAVLSTRSAGNPSVANAEKDDPTIRRCTRFAKSWSYGGIIVVNLFAFRATDPKRLVKALDPAGPDNDRHIRESVRDSIVICAWGIPCLMPRNKEVYQILVEARAAVFCLALTKDGHPKHPLYVPKKTEPIIYQPQWSVR
jgi:hypothetical protein